MILCIFMFLLLPDIAEITDFRNTRWGMSIEEVRGIEDDSAFIDSSKWKENIDRLSYYENPLVSGNARNYYFFDNRLFCGSYDLETEYCYKNLYGDRYCKRDHEEELYDYERIKELLTKKYGNPSEDKHIWEIDSMVKYYGFDGGPYDGKVPLYYEVPEIAIREGYLEYYTIWETQRTDIDLLLNSEWFRLRYGSIELQKLKKEKLLEKL